MMDKVRLFREMGLGTVWALRTPLASPDAAQCAPVEQVADPGTLDWPGLRAAVANCRACALCQARTQAVLGVGDIRADWLFVGEAPGAEEDARGEPFVGQAGRLLDNQCGPLGSTFAPIEFWSYTSNSCKNTRSAKTLIRVRGIDCWDGLKSNGIFSLKRPRRSPRRSSTPKRRGATLISLFIKWKRRLRRKFSRTRWVARLLKRDLSAPHSDEPGLVILQIDGLACPLVPSVSLASMPIGPSVTVS